MSIRSNNMMISEIRDDLVIGEMQTTMRLLHWNNPTFLRIVKTLHCFVCNSSCQPCLLSLSLPDNESNLQAAGLFVFCAICEAILVGILGLI